MAKNEKRETRRERLIKEGALRPEGNPAGKPPTSSAGGSGGSGESGQSGSPKGDSGSSGQHDE